MMSAYELWTWERCHESILSLKGRLGYRQSLWILGFKLLDDGRLLDPFHRVQVFDPAKAGPATVIPSKYSAVPEMYCILSTYSAAQEWPLTGEWVPLAALSPVRPQELPPDVCAALLEYAREDLAALQSVEIPFFGSTLDRGDWALEVWPLPRVPLSVVLWRGDEERAPGGSVLFDRSAVRYLPDLVSELAWLTVWRSRNILNPAVKWGYHGLAAGGNE